MEIMMLKSCLIQLEDSLNELSRQLDDVSSVFATDRPGPFSSGHEGIAIVRHGITDLVYEEGATDGRFTPICLGAVGASPKLMRQAYRVNESKDRFHLECRRFLEKATHKSKEMLSSAGKAKRLRAALHGLDYGRLSLRQCYRRIHLLDQMPHSIRFSYSTGGSSIRKLTAKQAVDLIDKSGMTSDSAVIDRNTLSKLAPDTPLAQVQRLAGYYKANIVYGLSDKDIKGLLSGTEASPEMGPATVPTFLPIFYPYDPKKQVISQLGLPDSDVGQPKDPRSDKKLKSTPIASSIRVYAYETEEERAERLRYQEKRRILNATMNTVLSCPLVKGSTL